MTKEEAKQIFLNRGFVEVDGGSIFDGDKWRLACRLISQWLEREDCNFVVHKDRTNQDWIDRCRICGNREIGTPIFDVDSQDWSYNEPLKCPFCNARFDWGVNYCPNCGGMMVRKVEINDKR